MQINKELLLREAASAGIPPEQAALLWTRLDAATEGQSKFDSLSVAYYFGGLIIIGAMTFFFTLAWDRVEERASWHSHWPMAASSAGWADTFSTPANSAWPAAC